MPVMINDEEYLTATESAEHLQVSPSTFLKWQKQHKLAYMTRPGTGNKKFFKKADLDKLVEWKASDEESI